MLLHMSRLVLFVSLVGEPPRAPIFVFDGNVDSALRMTLRPVSMRCLGPHPPQAAGQVVRELLESFPRKIAEGEGRVPLLGGCLLDRIHWTS
jgi:hypothetical protein